MYQVSIPEDVYDKFEDGTYRNAPEGFIEFVEDNVWVQIYPIGAKVKKWVRMGALPDTKHPETGRSYKGLWEKHKEVAREALRMKDGEFVYRLIVLCWMRGDGKSFLVVLIVIYKFYCFPDQRIALSANSKEQSKFVHFNDMCKIVNNSPTLLAILGEKNIQNKEIRMLDEYGNSVSSVQSVSTFTGVLSNITGYTFSEFFLLKNDSFFNEIDTSMRNVPNAFGLIDTTVAPKTHKLYHLYESWRKGEDETLFFSYRFSKNADPKDFWHPYMNKKQLSAYKSRDPLTFDKFFKNIWSAGADKVFTPAQIEAIYYLGAYRNLKAHDHVISAVSMRIKIEEGENLLKEQGMDGNRYRHHETQANQVAEIEKILWPADSIYQLRDAYGEPRICSLDELKVLGDLYDTEWSICAGLDRADPMKTRTSARTMVGALAKGLAGSRGNPMLGTLESPKYIYILVHLADVENHSLEGIKDELSMIHDEFDGIDTLCGERWGVWDLKDWCEENEVGLELHTGNYSVQLSAFTELYKAVDEGRLKSARVYVPGSKQGDILKEEFEEFDHDAETRWFGSSEKMKKGGIQDDAIYTIAWAQYGGRFKSADDFRPRGKVGFFGAFYPDRSLVGRY